MAPRDDTRPLCGIYFNLHSPYQKQTLPRTVRAVEEPIEEGRQSSEN